jgi:hypothetical protein
MSAKEFANSAAYLIGLALKALGMMTDAGTKFFCLTVKPRHCILIARLGLVSGVRFAGIQICGLPLKIANLPLLGKLLPLQAGVILFKARQFSLWQFLIFKWLASYTTSIRQASQALTQYDGGYVDF